MMLVALVVWLSAVALSSVLMVCILIDEGHLKGPSTRGLSAGERICLNAVRSISAAVVLLALAGCAAVERPDLCSDDELPVCLPEGLA